MTAYRSIENTPLESTGDADFENGTAVRFAGWQGKTLGFHGRDLGSLTPTPGRVPAFLGLAERTGGVYVENPPSVHQALRDTGLDFEVKLETATAKVTDVVVGPDGPTEVVRHLEHPDWRIITGHPKDGGEPFFIAPASRLYGVVQNEDALAWGDQISEGQLVALGAYGNPVGAKVYAAYDLGGMTVGGVDPHELFLTIRTSHDRSGGCTATVNPIRLGCTNQTNATFGRKATPRFTVRHTSNAKMYVQAAREALSLAFAYRDTYVEEAEKLLKVKIGKDAFVAFERKVFLGDKDFDKLTVGQQKRVSARDEQLLEILASATNEGFAGTAYGAYQTVVEYMDHFAPVKGADSAKARQERIMRGDLDVAKVRTWNLAAALAA